jgi:hypothetical protein
MALATIDVQLLDHIVVGKGYFSMADEGWLKAVNEEFKKLLID